MGLRNFRKALLLAMLTPHGILKQLQEEDRYTELMVMQEELKTYPWGAVWNEYCRRCGVKEDTAWLSDVKTYEKNVLANR